MQEKRYTANSVIGRSGMEGLFEKELKGQNGCRIYIVNSEDKEKEELACILVQHGQDIRLTIDTDLQVSLYEQFKEDKRLLSSHKSLYRRGIGFGQHTGL